MEKVNIEIREYPLETILYGLIITAVAVVGWVVDPGSMGAGWMDKINYFIFRWLGTPAASLLGPVMIIIGTVASVRYYKDKSRLKELIPSLEGLMKIIAPILFSILAIGLFITMSYLTYTITMWVLGWSMGDIKYSDLVKEIMASMVFITGVIFMIACPFLVMRAAIGREGNRE